MQQQIKTVCARDCYDSCSLIATVGQSKKQLLSLKGDQSHPITRGYTCPRAAHESERVYQNRVLSPYFNPNKSSKQPTAITWSKAIQMATVNLERVLQKYGPKKVLFLNYSGNMGLLTSVFSSRLWYALGATMTDHALCNEAGHKALSYHYGSSYGMQPEQFANQKLILIWGFNPVNSFSHGWTLCQKARQKNQAKIVVIDARQSETAARADLFLCPRPGSDTALALGLARYLMSHNLIDHDFIQNHTSGFDEYQTEALKWPLDRVEKETGIPEKQIKELALLLAKNSSLVILLGIGIQKHFHGAQMIRSISLLPALRGVHRGFFYSNSRGISVDLSYLSGEKLVDSKNQVVSQVELGTLLEKGYFKYIYIAGINPLITLPAQQKVKKGLSAADTFVVTHDSHWSETAFYSDLVLPAATYLEKEDLILPWGHWYIQKSNQVLSPLAESKTEWEVMRLFNQQLKMKEKWLVEEPWQALEKCMQQALEKEDLSGLKKGRLVRLKYKRYDQYQTPSGKIEFSSSLADRDGVNAVVQYHAYQLKQNEFILLNSATKNYTNSQFQESFGQIPAYVWIHPHDARQLKIKPKMLVKVYNQYGTIICPAIITKKVRPQTLWAPKQFTDLKGNTQNCLIDCCSQKIARGSMFNSIRVFIRPV